MHRFRTTQKTQRHSEGPRFNCCKSIYYTLSSMQNASARGKFNRVGLRFSSNSDFHSWMQNRFSLGLMAYTDSDWAANEIWQRSVTGYFFKLADGIVSWCSHAQKTVALSSTEAEYMAISDCSRQVVWIKTMIEELGIKLKAIPIYSDNQGSIFIASNPVQESRTKHIDIQYHYICEVVSAKKVELMFVPGEMNPTDMFTKNLGKIKFIKFRNHLGLDFEDSDEPPVNLL